MNTGKPLTPELAVIRLAHGEGLDLPSYATDGAAGMDLRAAVPAGEPMVLAPGERALVPTGLVMEIPASFEGQVRPRTIDSDYRGEVKVLLVNLGTADFVIERGMRIAQMVIAPVARASVSERKLASGTGRGAGGFGSTGTG